LNRVEDRLSGVEDGLRGMRGEFTQHVTHHPA
jgi:hypothetical protein